jgi:CheY-like chemotaxis protein
MQKHVLSVEDEGITAMNLAQTIENGGYRVTVAFDGREGLEAFYNDSADLVITDLNMPHSRRLRRDRHLKRAGTRNQDCRIIRFLPADRKRSHPQLGRRVHYV